MIVPIAVGYWLRINKTCHKILEILLTLKRLFQTKYITGGTGDSQALAAYLKDYSILCFTPQILVNNIDNKNIKTLSEFSLLIFDECHHAVKDTPYAKLARRYLVEKNNKGRSNVRLPQVGKIQVIARLFLCLGIANH